MFALEIEYLMGRVVASERDDRRSVEWPPHPSRLFAALTAAFKECELGDNERAALEWLEALPPPDVYAEPPDHEGWVRDVVTCFVPVGDAVAKNALPGGTDGKERWFPAFTPTDNHVWFIWRTEDDIKQYIKPLGHIAENVTYLGHSMSPVRVSIGNNPPIPTLTPSKEGKLKLRVTGKGRLRYLETLHKQRIINETIQPRLGKVARYKVKGDQAQITPTSLFRHGYVFRRTSGVGLPLEWTTMLVDVVRRALLSRIENIRKYEQISGHDNSSRPTQKPHMAIVPLADIGHRYADGHIMGFALWLPDDIEPQALEALEDAIYDFDELKLGRFGEWKIERVNAEQATRAPKALRLTTYTQKHLAWASVTPVIFGHYPKKSQVGPGKGGGKVFAELCEMINLPKPIEARIGPISVFSGVPKASEFEYPTKQGNGKLMAHVWFRFTEPVHGPVLIGAGRFFGFGMCRPVISRKDS